MKILVIQQKMIGDVLTSTILLEALRNAYPKAELHYAVNANTLPVLENNPFIDKTLTVTSEMEKNKYKFYGFLKKIQSENYAIAIDVYGKISSGFMAYFSKADTRIAYHKNHNSFVYSKTVNRLKIPRHNYSLAIENRLRLLEPLDIPFEPLSPKIYLKASEIDAAKTILLNTAINLNKPLVMVSILGSELKKTYPKNYMAELLDFCVETNPNIQFLFNYIPRQKSDAQYIYSQTTTKTQKRIFFGIFGKSLREFLALTANCDAVIGNEGGANNMAKALDISTFSIFSPYLPKQNWFGNAEKEKHMAVHLSDYTNFNEEDKNKAKKNPKVYYQKFKPDFVKAELKRFLDRL